MIILQIHLHFLSVFFPLRWDSFLLYSLYWYPLLFRSVQNRSGALRKTQHAGACHISFGTKIALFIYQKRSSVSGTFLQIIRKLL
jgi:hypothetical protein